MYSIFNVISGALPQTCNSSDLKKLLVFCSWTFAVEVIVESKTFTRSIEYWYGSYRPGGPRIPVRFFRSGGFGYSLIDGALNGVLQVAYIHWNVGRHEAW